MSAVTVPLPFARTVTLERPHPGTGAREALVIDTLPVTLAVYRTGGPAAVQTTDGRRMSVRHVAGGRAYAGLADESGLAPDAAAARLARLIQDDAHRLPTKRVHEPFSLEGLKVADDGTEAQRAAVREFQARSAIVGGLLMTLMPAPRAEVRIAAGGRVELRVPLLGHGGRRMASEPPVPAWLAFSLDRMDEARAMADGLAAALPGLGLGGTRGVDAAEWHRWEVMDPVAFSGLPYADGGPGTRAERISAMASEFAAAVAPHAGLLPVAAIRAFADLCEAVEAGSDPEPAMMDLAGFLDVRELKGIEAKDALRLRFASIGLRMRVEGHEPRDEPAPGPR